jgi:hypothetical protein
LLGLHPVAGLRRALGLCLALALCGAGARASAEPANGFGAALGVTANTYTGTKPYSSAGGSLAGDMQFAVNDAWSLNPYLMLSGEALFGGATGAASNGVAGFEVRRWWGERFVGAHLAAYTTLIATRDGSSNLYDPGVGATLGVERADGFGYALVADLPRILIPVAGLPVVKVNLQQAGFRLHLGFRFR